VNFLDSFKSFYLIKPCIEPDHTNETTLTFNHCHEHPLRGEDWVDSVDV
jgi:hypothetical protein